MTEQDLTKADSSLKTTTKPGTPLKRYTRKVDWNGRNVSFECNIEFDKVTGTHYIYTPDWTNAREDSVAFLMKAYVEITKTMGPPQSAVLEKYPEEAIEIFENGTLPPFSETVLNQIITYCSAHTSVAISLRYTWETKNGIETSLVLGLYYSDKLSPAKCYINLNKAK